jgi:hypothetical protein
MLKKLNSSLATCDFAFDNVCLQNLLLTVDEADAACKARGMRLFQLHTIEQITALTNAVVLAFGSKETEVWASAPHTPVCFSSGSPGGPSLCQPRLPSYCETVPAAIVAK